MEQPPRAQSVPPHMMRVVDLRRPVQPGDPGGMHRPYSPHMRRPSAPPAVAADQAADAPGSGQEPIDAREVLEHMARDPGLRQDLLSTARRAQRGDFGGPVEPSWSHSSSGPRPQDSAHLSHSLRGSGGSGRRDPPSHPSAAFPPRAAPRPATPAAPEPDYKEMLEQALSEIERMRLTQQAVPPPPPWSSFHPINPGASRAPSRAASRAPSRAASHVPSRAPTPLPRYVPTPAVVPIIQKDMDNALDESSEDEDTEVKLPNGFMKGLKCEQYGGRPEDDVRNFIAEYERYCCVTNTPRRAWGRGVQGFLKDGALRWFNLLPKRERKGYAYLKAKLLAEYGGAQALEAQNKINNKKMDLEKTTVTEFIHDLKRLVHIANPESTQKQMERTTCWHLVNAAPQSLKRLCAAVVNSPDLEKVTEAFIGAETFLNAEKAKAPSGRKHAFSTMRTASAPSAEPEDKKGEDPQDQESDRRLVKNALVSQSELDRVVGQHKNASQQLLDQNTLKMVTQTNEILSRLIPVMRENQGLEQAPARNPPPRPGNFSDNRGRANRCYTCDAVHTPPWCRRDRVKYTGKVVPGNVKSIPNFKHPSSGNERGTTPPRPQVNQVKVAQRDAESEGTGRKVVLLTLSKKTVEAKAEPREGLGVWSPHKYEEDTETSDYTTIKFREPKEPLEPKRSKSDATTKWASGWPLLLSLLVAMFLWAPLPAGAEKLGLPRRPARSGTTEEIGNFVDWLAHTKDLETFRSFDHTYFGRERRAALKELPKMMADEAREDPLKAPLVSLYEQMPKLGAVTNLNLGAPAIPEGLVLRSVSKRYYYNVLDASVPYWQPISLRHPEARNECAGMPGELEKFCLDTISPIIQRKVCPYADVVQEEYRKAIADHIHMYEGAISVDYFRQWLHTFCENGDLCDLPNSSPAPSRKKRWVEALISGSGSAIGMAGLGVSMWNGHRISSMSSEIGELNSYMRKTAISVRTLHDGLVQTDQQLIRVNEYVARAMAGIYSNIEDFRCQQSQTVHDLAVHTDRGLFRAYVSDIRDAVAESANTGRLTPRVLPVQELRLLISKDEDASVRESLIADDPSLVYRFGRVIPVRLDLPTLRYGYVLEVPVPGKEDVLPLYRIYNAGFDMGGSASRHARDVVPRTRTYRVPLPRHAVYVNGGFQGLDINTCQQTPGLALCDLPSVLPRTKGPKCLQVLLSGVCDSCEIEVDCMSSMEPVLYPERTKVIVTIAGLLIRTGGAPPKMLKGPLKAKGASQVSLPRSVHGTYWVRHNDFTTLSIGGMVYLRQDQAVHTTRVFPPRPFNLSLLSEQTFEAPQVSTLVDLERHQQVLKRLVEKVKMNTPPPPPNESAFSRYAYLVPYFVGGGAVVLLMAMLCYCCCCDSQAKRDKWSQCWRGFLARWSNPDRPPTRKDGQWPKGVRYHAPLGHGSDDEDRMSYSYGYPRESPSKTTVVRVSSNGGLHSPFGSQIAEVAIANDENNHATHSSSGPKIEPFGEQPLFSVGDTGPSTSRLSNRVGAPAVTFAPPRALGAPPAYIPGPPSRQEDTPGPPSRQDTMSPQRAQSPSGPRSAGSFVNLLKPSDRGMQQSPSRNTRSRGKTHVNVILSRNERPFVLATQSRRRRVRPWDESDAEERRLGFTRGVDLWRGRMMVDPAADISLMSPAFADKVGFYLEAVDPEEAEIDGACSMGRVSHKLRSGVYLAGHLLEHTFYIPDGEWEHGLFDALVGTDFLARIGRVIFDYGENICTLVDQRTGTKYTFLMDNRRPIMANQDQELMPERWTLAAHDVHQYSSEESVERGAPNEPSTGSKAVESEDMPLHAFLRDQERQKQQAQARKAQGRDLDTKLARQVENLKDQMYRSTLKDRLNPDAPPPRVTRQTAKADKRSPKGLTPVSLAAKEQRTAAEKESKKSKKNARKLAEKQKERELLMEQLLSPEAPTDAPGTSGVVPPVNGATATQGRGALVAMAEALVGGLRKEELAFESTSSSSGDESDAGPGDPDPKTTPRKVPSLR